MKPVQSMKKSPAATRPSSSTTPETSPRLCMLDLDHPSLAPHDAPRLGVATQEAGIEGGVEMIGVAQAGQGRLRPALRMDEPPPPRGLPGHGIGVQRIGLPLGAGLQPEVMKGDALHIDAEGAEWMEVALALATPAVELDPQLEGGLGLAQEIRLVDAEPGVELQESRGLSPRPRR